MWNVLLPLALILAPLFVTYNRSTNDGLAGYCTTELTPVIVSTTSGFIDEQESSHYYYSRVHEFSDYVPSDLDTEYAFRLYVTPGDSAIKALAERIDSADEAYEIAFQWIYVSDLKLNCADDVWLTPHKFLVDTPFSPGNPHKGDAVSDCEEQANTLVSLIRALGIPPEEIRVALGVTIFGDVETGHAWVELLNDGEWLTLDPSWGPYWDDQAGKLVHRSEVPFNHYSSHTYPVVQVWSYYNDVYYLGLTDNSGNAPAWWRKITQTE